MKYDSILFDLDGTLWDSTIGVQKTWELLSEELSLPVPTLEALAGIMGLSPADVMKKLFPELSKERGLEIFHEFAKAEAEYLSKNGGTLYPQIINLLETLSKEYPLFIVSNCESGYIESFLHSHSTQQYFTDWECIGETGKNKTENILLIVERNNLKKPVYVGDTLWDMKAAGGAGVPFIHAAYGFGEVDSNIPKISNPMELINLLENIAEET